ncbi:MAG: hypothetical protein ACHQ4H_08075 [Ktedonobacterales bacterium]
MAGEQQYEPQPEDVSQPEVPEPRVPRQSPSSERFRAGMRQVERQGVPEEGLAEPGPPQRPVRAHDGDNVLSGADE